MAASAGIDFDQISLSSSCEIVDGLAEAVQDHHLAQKNTQPAHKKWYPNLAQMDGAEEVMFTYMQDSYSMNRDLVVQYKYRDNTKEGGCYGDRVGLYKMPNTQPHKYLAYVWVSRGEGVATMDMTVFPVEQGEYLLQYIQGDNTVVGTSTTFQMIRDVESGVEELKPMIEENDKENYMVEKSEIPVIDEQRCQEVEAAVLAAKAEEVKILTTRLTDEEARFGKVLEENRNLSKEKEDMSRILESELERSAKLINEKAELVDKLEDFSLQIRDANKDRDLAVEELRALIEQQDTLRKELAKYREETGNAEAELISIKQEMAQINMRINDGNSERFGAKIKDLAGNLEIHKKFLREANGKVEKLEEDVSEINEEKVDLELKLKELVTMNKSMKESVEMLEHEKIGDRFSNNGANITEDTEDRSKISFLEEQVKVLNQQLMEARLNSTMVKFGKTALEKQARSKRESLEKSSHTAVSGKAQTSSTAPSLFKEFPPPTVSIHHLPPTASVLPTPSTPVLPTHDSAPVLPAHDSATVLPTPPSAPVLPTLASAPVLPTHSTLSLECPFCGDFYPGNQKKELECHVEQHMEGMLECPICNMTFERRFQLLLETHVELHFKSQDQELEELPLDARGWDLGID